MWLCGLCSVLQLTLRSAEICPEAGVAGSTAKPGSIASPRVCSVLPRACIAACCLGQCAAACVPDAVLVAQAAAEDAPQSAVCSREPVLPSCHARTSASASAKLLPVWCCLPEGAVVTQPIVGVTVFAGSLEPGVGRGNSRDHTARIEAPKVIRRGSREPESRVHLSAVGFAQPAAGRVRVLCYVCSPRHPRQAMVRWTNVQYDLV